MIRHPAHAATEAELLAIIREDFDYPRFKEEIRRSITDRKLIQRTVADPAARPWRYYPESRGLMRH